MKLSINVPFEFRASHHLPVRRELHEHLFRLVVSIEGTMDPANGFIVDMQKVRDLVTPLIEELDASTLNDHSLFAESKGTGAMAATHPTCETLVHYFVEALRAPINAIRSAARLKRVDVHIVNEDKNGSDANEWGYASLEL